MFITVQLQPTTIKEKREREKYSIEIKYCVDGLLTVLKFYSQSDGRLHFVSVLAMWIAPNLFMNKL